LSIPDATSDPDGPGKSRQGIALGSPDRDLSDFPVRAYPDDEVIYRAHGVDWGPWWFSSDMSGRFDLPAHVGGTCYLAGHPRTALRESLGQKLSQARVVPMEEIQARRVSKLTPPCAIRAANTIHADAGNYGVTRKISGFGKYEVTQRWALRFHEYGFAGITYEGRFDPARDAECLALFDRRAGAASYPEDPNPRPGLEVAKECGIRVAGAPARTSLTVQQPPG
jgi:hypothetical protein